MCQEQSWLLLLHHLCDVGLAASWLSTLLSPMAKLTTVVAGAVSCRLPHLRSPVEGGDSPFFPSPWQAPNVPE
jgi:hypothetical protein